MALMHKGKTLYLQGKYNDAIKCYDKLLSIDSGYPYAKQEKEKASKALYGNNYTAPEDTADYWIEKGNNLYKQGKYRDSIECYRPAILIDNKNIRALMNTANAYYVLKEYRDALTWYEAVLSWEPDNANAKTYKEKCLKAMEKK